MSEANQDGQRINRKLKYKELIEKGTRISETLENQNVLESFKNILELINICESVSTDYAAQGKIEHTSDYLMDASIIKMGHDLMGTTAERMADNNFNEDEYVAALLDLMTATGPDDKLLEISIECCKTTQFQLSMLGTFSFDEAAPKQQKVKSQRQVRSKLGAKKAPENVTQIVKVDKGAEKINIMRLEIERICKERRKTAIPYFELIIDPQSFMNSVDAGFQLSFLIRDGIVGVKRIDQEPHVHLIDSHQKTAGDNSSNTVQTVTSLSPATWQKEIARYKLSVPLLRLNYDENEDGSDSSEDL